MGRLNPVASMYVWPPALATFDETRWPDKSSWHLARCAYATEHRWYEPGKFIRLDELRAAIRRPPIEAPERIAP